MGGAVYGGRCLLHLQRLTILTLALIALGVAMDATAVSAGYALRGLKATGVMVLALTFGAAQTVMALIGAVGGETIEPWIGPWDHWVAFGLLLFVGVRMMREAFEEENEEEERAVSLSVATVVLLAVATSIDSLAVGLTLPTIGLPIVTSTVVIGVVTAVCSMIGAWIGSRLGEQFGRRIEVIGGVILIGIGVHVLVEHTIG